MPQRTVLLVALLASTLAFADDLDAGLAQGAALAARGERAAARAVFEALATAHPDRPEPLNDLAAMAAAEGDLAGARQLLERALATHPSYRTVHDNLAALYAAEAGAAYRKALPLAGAPSAPPELVVLSRAAAPAVVAVAPAPNAAPTPVAVPIAQPSVSQAPPAPRPRDAFDAHAAAAFGAVEAWARAWAARDVAGYLAAYAPEFVPPDGLSRAAWEAQRAVRIRAPQRIAISLHDRHLTIDPDGARARITFVQRYRSDRFNGDSFKTMTLVARDGRWAIAAERTGR